MKRITCIFIAVVVASVFTSGCGTKVNKPLNGCDRFTVIERFESDEGFPTEYIVVDNKTGYEYFVTHNRDSDIIGGNVLDEDGHPKKYVK